MVSGRCVASAVRFSFPFLGAFHSNIPEKEIAQFGILQRTPNQKLFQLGISLCGDFLFYD